MTDLAIGATVASSVYLPILCTGEEEGVHWMNKKRGLYTPDYM